MFRGDERSHGLKKECPIRFYVPCFVIFNVFKDLTAAMFGIIAGHFIPGMDKKQGISE